MALLTKDPWAEPLDWGSPAPDPATPDSKPLEPWTLSTKWISMSEPVGHGIVTSIHARSIIGLAVTEDGQAAVTTDGRSVRLWPSLDGKREPVVVAMRAPLALALGRNGDALVIAGLDAIGQLEIVRTDANGARLSRVAIDSARPVRQVFAIWGGVLALRDDDSIVVYEPTGAVRSELAPVARQRVKTIAVRHEHVLAFVESGGAVHAQPIELQAGRAAWGTAAPPLSFAPEHVALSTDARRFGASDKDGSIFVIDVATSRVARKHKIDPQQEEPFQFGGFLDADTVVADNRGSAISIFTDPDFYDPDSMFGTPYVVADGMVIGATTTSLVIGRKGKETRYLGYQMSGSMTLVPTAKGFLATEGTSLVELGADLRARKTMQLGPHEGPLQYPLIVDETHVVTGFAYGYENPEGVAMVDLKRGTVTPLAKGWAMFDHEHGLLAIQSNDGFELRRFDRKKGRFSDPETTKTNTNTNTQVVWLEHKGVDFAFVTRDVNDEQVTIDFMRLRDKLEVVKSKTVKPDPSWFESPDGELLIDEAWRIPTRRPSPDGKWVAELRRDGRLTLQDEAGKEQWMVSGAGATDVAWTPKGELVAFGLGVARVDLATGALLERQCGWQFGLWKEQLATTPAASLCEAP